MQYYYIVKSVILEYINESKTLQTKKLFEIKDLINLLPHETLLEKKHDLEFSNDLLICKNNMWMCKKYRETYEHMIDSSLKNKIAQIYVKSSFSTN
jgi:hypothetical protein